MKDLIEQRPISFARKDTLTEKLLRGDAGCFSLGGDISQVMLVFLCPLPDCGALKQDLLPLSYVQMLECCCFHVVPHLRVVRGSLCHNWAPLVLLLVGILGSLQCWCCSLVSLAPARIFTTILLQPPQVLIPFPITPGSGAGLVMAEGSHVPREPSEPCMLKDFT